MSNGPSTRGGRAKLESWKRWHSTEHWKYPQTVGNDTRADNISFNSHESSEYAIKRMDKISTMTQEPFMMFEFMTIDIDESNARNTRGANELFTKLGVTTAISTVETGKTAAGIINDFAEGNNDLFTNAENADYDRSDGLRGFIKELSSAAKRNYTGSIALYMPTDIQVNDSMIYNEDTRKLGAAIQSFAEDGLTSKLVNWTVISDPTVLATAALAASAVGLPPAIGVILGGAVGTVASTEVQRHTGKVMNPNELVRYQQTALRTFTFNWTILPDNEHESKQAAGLIKFFRKSAHAKKDSSTLVTVPDHVITSFHGAGGKDVEMIQLPPCVIESVNVTYNPNNTSFFKQNNAPVEIGLSVALKEIVPIYAADVERGL